MKIRIGVGLGAGVGPTGFADAIDQLEAAGVDSVWLSEVVLSHQVDPFVGMAYALSRTTRLKVGTGVAVLPGRHPMLVAKQLASLAGLAPRRVLPVFGLQPARRRERGLFPIPTGQRGAVFDESIQVLRKALRQERVNHHGTFFDIEDAGVGPLPAKPLDVWLGGSAPAALRRIGRWADGWLASFVTPQQAARGRATIQAAAAEAGREIEEDHFGCTLVLATDGIPPALAAAIRERQPDLDPAELVAHSWSDARRLVEQYVEAGLSKFVIVPSATSPAFGEFLDGFTTELMPLQN
ncbi:TIGR03854 family LLM class F420-dependent oxidoreductase [Solihabitans fulvus]|uniref:TIGR03854 family LLM class F420-dependent oxidoreductase n=1 Tax=Solihabitans fulvus TaxID=1892852 RepID=UPI001661A788|nr:TIGR03854 family LLM class F420-dependent oxidoreductase [Solihabitans fulvus]